jgi:alpha-amylase
MAQKIINLALALHNHQPVGNFPHVFEMAYQKSYLPFLDEFEKHPNLKITLHNSGCLLEWIETAHPEYFKRVNRLVSEGRVELMAGGFYEPILVMLPDEDRRDQIQMLQDYLKTHFKADAKGAWVPERVWEQSLCAPLVDVGVQYIILDDFHFKNAGLSEEELTGCFLTEDQGNILRIFFRFILL